MRAALPRPGGHPRLCPWERVPSSFPIARPTCPQPSAPPPPLLRARVAGDPELHSRRPLPFGLLSISTHTPVGREVLGPHMALAASTCLRGHQDPSPTVAVTPSPRELRVSGTRSRNPCGVMGCDGERARRTRPVLPEEAGAPTGARSSLRSSVPFSALDFRGTPTPVLLYPKTCLATLQYIPPALLPERPARLRSQWERRAVASPDLVMHLSPPPPSPPLRSTGWRCMTERGPSRSSPARRTRASPC